MIGDLLYYTCVYTDKWRFLWIYGKNAVYDYDCLLTAIAILIQSLCLLKSLSHRLLTPWEVISPSYRHVSFAFDGCFCDYCFQFRFPDGWLSACYCTSCLLSHCFLVLWGALYLKKFPETLDKPKASWIFNFVLGVVHAIAEVIACIIFYATSGQMLKICFMFSLS